jgi:hypothetical protein
MNMETVEKIANAVLYEGYMLYPYRPSSTKNQQRWNFGTLYPPNYVGAKIGAEPCSMETQCLAVVCPDAEINIRLRFLQFVNKEAGENSSTWLEAVEQTFNVQRLNLRELASEPVSTPFDVSADSKKLQGRVEVSAAQLESQLMRLSARVTNISNFAPEDSANRDKALLQSLISAHFILNIERGEFVSLLDPPPRYAAAAEACKNVGAFPVLVGDEGDRTIMLSSPIILYDYPKIAPESRGDFFDGTEIDEMLTLRVMTLTPDEQQEIDATDERARKLLERTMSIPREQMMKLHGGLRTLRRRKEESQ